VASHTRVIAALLMSSAESTVMLTIPITSSYATVNALPTACERRY
jgi:hypothetical protein